MSQHKYIMDLLQKFYMTERVPEPTPQAKSKELEKEVRMSPEQIAAQSFDYRGLVGSLMAAQRVLKYLKGTSTYDLIFDDAKKYYMLYTDVSFANANENRKSVTGYVSIMADACITWKSSRQDTVSLHTAQAELIAASEGVKESEWLWYLLEELGFKQKRPIVCWCDNKGAISIRKDPANHASTKHINIKEQYARAVHEEGRIVVTYCSTNDMVADALTKALPQTQFEKLRSLMGVKALSLPVQQ
ncbi:unnamed protein product [Phytophthora fragariaefolia]|uniref:Unnamed protein product n=1 Tax=Phytophthora fragariaefolia TaxID=1490495 RepID=A0A9W6TWM0_9STRA|nr:unnamed protein product [Phytophthora fragariaefolia]